MSEEETKKSASGLVGSIFPFLHPEARGVISFVFAGLALYGGLYAFIFMPKYFSNLVENSKSTEHCWKLRELQQSLVKFNKCTGEVARLDMSLIQSTNSDAQKKENK